MPNARQEAQHGMECGTKQATSCAPCGTAVPSRRPCRIWVQCLAGFCWSPREAQKPCDNVWQARASSNLRQALAPRAASWNPGACAPERLKFDRLRLTSGRDRRPLAPGFNPLRRLRLECAACCRLAQGELRPEKWASRIVPALAAMLPRSAIGSLFATAKISCAH